MTKVSQLPSILAGFIGGMAFLISCGGGSGGVTNEVSAQVPTEQMYCTSNNRLVAPTGINNEIDVYPLRCYDSNGNLNNNTSTLADYYAQGWRISLMTENPGTGPSPFSYVFEK